MRDVMIDEVAISPTGELLVRPSLIDPSFQFVYCAALAVHWDEAQKCFFTPAPREWSYGAWFSQVLSAVRSELAFALRLTPETAWRNINNMQRAEIEQAAKHPLFE